MNIKVKAALEVTGGILAMVLIIVGLRMILDLLSETYGSQVVFNGIIFVIMSTAAYVMVGLLYDIRVNQLKYKEKLNEMVNK